MKKVAFVEKDFRILYGGVIVKGIYLYKCTLGQYI